MPRRSRTWLSATVQLSAMTIFARVVGFARDALIAFRFGASTVTDAYLIAYLLPNFLTAMLSGALNSIIVPRVAGELARGNERQAWRLLLGATAWIVMLLGLLTGLISAFSGPLLHALAPGFTPAEHHMAVRLSHILIWVVFFSTTGYLAGSILNAYHRFAFAALAPALVSGAAVLILALTRHPPIFLLARAILGGAILQFLLTWIPLVPYLARLRPKPTLVDPGLGRLARLSTPILLSSTVSQSNLAVDRIFGSTLAAGSITALSFSDRILQVPLGVFGAAISTALFPRLSQAHALSDHDDFQALLTHGLRLVLLITLPVSALLFADGRLVVDLLFRHGHFTHAAARLTTWCVYAYALALIAYSLNIVITRAYFVLEASRYIGYTSLLVLVLNALLDWWLSRIMQAPGVALGTTVVEWIYVVLLFYYLDRILHKLDVRPVLSLLLTLIGPTSVAGIAMEFIARFPFAHATIGGWLVRLMTSVALGVTVYLAGLYLLKVPEMRSLLRRLTVARA